MLWDRKTYYEERLSSFGSSFRRRRHASQVDSNILKHSRSGGRQGKGREHTNRSTPHPPILPYRLLPPLLTNPIQPSTRPILPYHLHPSSFYQPQFNPPLLPVVVVGRGRLRRWVVESYAASLALLSGRATRRVSPRGGVRSVASPCRSQAERCVFEGATSPVGCPRVNWTRGVLRLVKDVDLPRHLATSSPLDDNRPVGVARRVSAGSACRNRSRSSALKRMLVYCSDHKIFMSLLLQMNVRDVGVILS
ncbi:uncharacterized protein B0T15DRAFT_543353 [Chaetomium strumarium]|uniref:Uncharacterized protein n=1 Tax=Chaetomium strumarium TaxID=1170767 RepID=A0AAJ0GMC3_9PEZI|nr:hypothetical protein B0T15DRAFT_543353 [Chaetomium strumarium]